MAVAARSRIVTAATQFAQSAITYCDSECQQATTMAVGELAENVVKYSAPGQELQVGSIAIAVIQNTVRIRATTDTVCSAADADRREHCRRNFPIRQHGRALSKAPPRIVRQSTCQECSLA